MYITTIRKIQPQGPYLLGRWSLGGIHAYEVAGQLTSQGEQITGVIMIDSPCPKALPCMPEPTIELLEQTGIFIGIQRAGRPDAQMPMVTKERLVSCICGMYTMNLGLVVARFRFRFRFRYTV